MPYFRAFIDKANTLYMICPNMGREVAIALPPHCARLPIAEELVRRIAVRKVVRLKLR